MKYIYGLNISGQSVIKYFLTNNISFLAWDDNNVVREFIENKYNNINFVHPKDLDWSKIDEALVSPGIDLNSKLLVKARNYKNILHRDLELYSAITVNKKIIAVTGTNGKSTTVKLIGDILKSNDINCFIGGNFGPPLLDYYNQNNNANHHVIELSSYQLEAAPSFKSFISILLNISDDHQDNYKSIEKYASTKEKIVSARENLYSIISLDDNYCKEIYQRNVESDKITIPISSSNEISNGVYLLDNKIYDNFFKKNSFSLNEISHSLKGKINNQNILASYVVNEILNLDYKSFLYTIKNFVGLSHRLEFIYENDKYLIINNSKATNFDSSIKTIENFDNIFLILGGRVKNNDFSIFKTVKKKISNCYIIGESTELIFKQVSMFFKSSKNFTLENAIDQIFKDLSYFDLKVTILLAPACSSFDQFKNFEERGDKFKKIIMKKIY